MGCCGGNNYLYMSPFNFRVASLRATSDAIYLSGGYFLLVPDDMPFTLTGLFGGASPAGAVSTSFTAYSFLRTSGETGACALLTRAPAFPIGARVLCTLRQAVTGRTTFDMPKLSAFCTSVRFGASLSKTTRFAHSYTGLSTPFCTLPHRLGR